MHLVDSTFEAISNDHFRKEVLARLAVHPQLAPEAREYLAKSLTNMSSRHYRKQVLEALHKAVPVAR